jgi:stage II sporulation protein P
LNYKRFSRQDNPKLEILTLIISLIFVIILPYLVKASNTSTVKAKGNMFYVQVLNYTMPAVKATCFNEDDMAENSFSLENTPLGIFNINIKSPLSVLENEVAFLGINDFKNSVTKFKLDDTQIAKADGNENLSRGSSVFDPSLKRTMNKEKPDVLIYHTHTTESYKPGGPNSFDDSKNVCAVGDQLVAELKKYGIYAINDKTVHDAEAYTQSYSRSSVTLDKYLKKYGDFKLVIDMHRDASENKNATTININGENVAKYMFVMAKKNPHFDKNMILVNKILALSKKLYPGLSNGVYYYNYGTRYFNQDKSNNALLMEVGSDVNTTTESKATMKYVARIIAQVIE